MLGSNYVFGIMCVVMSSYATVPIYPVANSNVYVLIQVGPFRLVGLLVWDWGNGRCMFII